MRGLYEGREDRKLSVCVPVLFERRGGGEGWDLFPRDEGVESLVM